MKVSVVVPAYHEEKTVIPGLLDLIQTLDFLQVDYEILVVVDGDPKTRQALENFKHEKLKVISYEVNCGKGYALLYGFRQSLGEAVIFWDAGTQISQESLKLAWRTFSFTEADIVLGSKRHPLSKVAYPLKRRFYSLVCQLAAWVAFGLNVKDTQTGLKIFKREILEKIAPKIRTKGYAVDIEMLVATRSLGYKKIVETPVDLSHFKFGGGVNYKAVYQVALDMLRTYFRLLIGRYKDYKQTTLFLTIDLEKDPWENRIPQTEIDSILEKLEQAKQKITFFVCGDIYEENTNMVRSLILSGHEVGLHSFSHQRLTAISDLESELKRAHRFIEDLKPKGFRAPFMDLPTGGLEVLKKYGFSYDSSCYYNKRRLNKEITEYPATAIGVIPFGSRGFKTPLNFSQTLIRGMFPLGGGIITAVMPSLQRSLVERFNNCVVFLHPWQFVNRPFFKSLLKKPKLAIYGRNCSADFEIMLTRYTLKKMEEHL